MEGLQQAAAEELIAFDSEWKSTLKDMLVEELTKQQQDSVEIDDIVEFFHSASTNAKYGAADVAQFTRRLNTIRVATLALLKI